MNNVRKIIKVFIASPGDLGNERQIARDVAEEYNGNNSELTGYQIEMVGWEETIGGIGRPQEIINKDLARCELFVGMLWKRWGTPPDNNGRYTSGFEEEFQISFERYAKEKKPKMLMMFKDVDEGLLQDPGEALKKVLEFKNTLIKEKRVLYEVFNDEREYEKKLRRWLTAYVNNLVEEERERLVSEGTDETAKTLNSSNFDEIAVTKESESDTSKFFDKLYNSISGGLWSNLTSPDIAFFKLIAFSLSRIGNDNDYLGAHDANLIFSNKDSYNFNYALELNLAKSGLNGYGNKNIPLWKWLSFESERVGFYMAYFDGQIKSKYIDVLTFLSYKNDVIDDEVKSEWFGNNASEDIRLSGIRYLAKLGVKSDIDVLMVEYEKRNSRTLNSALEAIIAINLRESTLRGFESILELQPSSLGNRIVKQVKDGLEYVDLSLVERGLGCASADLRLVCLDFLIRSGCLDDDKIDVLLENDDLHIRLKLLSYMSEKNKIFYGLKAESLLKINKDVIKKDQYYDKYLSLSLQFEELDVLNKRLSSEFSVDAKILIALAKKDKKSYLPKIRGYLNDRCESYYSENLKVLLVPGQSEVPYLTEAFKNIIKSNMISDCLTWLASCMLKEDLPLIRRVVEKGDVLVLEHVMDYFKKYGEWEDIDLLDKSRYSNSQMLLAMYSENNVVFEHLAEVFLNIAKGRESDLIFSNVNNSIKARVITKLSVRAFSELSDSQISILLNDGDLLIREKAALRVIESFSKSRIGTILSIVLNDVTYFYNVVHWLDLGLSVKQSLFQPAVRQLLKE